MLWLTQTTAISSNPSQKKLRVLKTLLAFVYPVYKSVEALMTEDVQDDLMWLRYWVMLAMISLLEMVVDPLVDFFPFYMLGKCCFLIWCMAPSPNNGASFIFTQVIFPLLKKRYRQRYPF